MNKRRAFTILELLTAMAIFCFMVVALVNITGQAGDIWKKGEGQNQRRSNGRALLQNIAKELQLAVLPVDAPLSKTSPGTAANLQFVANMSSNPANNTMVPTSLLNPHAVFWQAPIARDLTAGDLACVGYFVKWDTSGDRPKAQLCRYFVNPSDMVNYLIYNQSGGVAVNWLSNISSVAPSTSTNLQGWFADNVIGFWVRCLDDQGEPIKRTAGGTELTGGYGFDSRQGYIDSEGRMHPAPALPAAVDIAIVTLDQQTASRLTSPLSIPAGSPETFQQDITDFVSSLPPQIKPGAQIFSTRVYLQNYRP